MNEMDGLDRTPLIHELEANLWEMWSAFGCGPGCALHGEGDALWFENPIPIIPHNGILKFQVDEDVDQRIDHVVECFRQRRVTFMWILHPTSKPLDLPERLRQRGLKEVELLHGMARWLTDLPASPPIREGIEVRKVVEETDASKPPRSKLRGIISGQDLIGGCRPQTPAGHSSPQQAGGHPGELSEYYEFASWRWGVPEDYHDQLSATLAEFRLGSPGAKAHAWQAWRHGQPVAKVGLYLTARSAGI
jgi:hypothetical protein